MSNEKQVAVTEQAPLVTRREAIFRVSALLGGALVGQSALLASCTSPASRDVDRASTTGPGATPGLAPSEPFAAFTRAELALLDEIAETILPETATPGAKAAGVGPFIAHMVTNAYSPRQQGIFRAGLVELDARAQRTLGAPFASATSARRLELLEQLDREQYDYTRANASDPTAAPHYFRMMKELALLGYFTSEIGYTQAQRYIEAPGRFDPDVPYSPGERAWAPHA